MSQMQENKMGVMPIRKLVLSMSIPMMLSMLVQALYNIVDSMYVSYVSEAALTAVSLAFPVQNLMISVSTGIGVGMNAMLSRALGSKDSEHVNMAATHGILLIAIGYIIFLIFGLVGLETFMRAQTDIQEIVEMGVEYLQVVCIASFVLFGQITVERLLQATGRSMYSMITQMVGAIINIILDPVLIFGYLGMPAMGVTGAAVATVIGQAVAMAIGIYLNVRRNPEINLSFKHFKLHPYVIGRILYTGIPSVLLGGIGSVMTFCMNKILFAFSSTAVAVLGVYFKIQSFVFMPVFGLNNGTIPILAYNYGAGKKERMYATIRFSMVFASCLMLVGCAIFEIIPNLLLAIFDASDAMLSIGVPALRIIATHFVLAGISIICTSSCQALGYSIFSMIGSAIRQLVVLLPVAYLLAQTGVLDLVWLAFPIAELISLLVNLFFLSITLKKLQWPEEKPEKAIAS